MVQKVLRPVKTKTMKVSGLNGLRNYCVAED